MGQGLFVQSISVDLIAAGHHGQQSRSSAHLFDLLELGQQVVHVELVFHQALGSVLSFLVRLNALRLFDQGEHIAHAQDSAGHAGRIERLEVLQLFAGALEVDGLAGDSQDGKRCAAAGVAVGLGQDDTGDADLLVEGLGHVDGLLAGHGIHDQQRFVDLDMLLDADQLVHQGIVNLQTACGIKDHDVIAVVPGISHGLFGDELGLLGAHREDGHVDLLTNDLQLLDSGGTVDVTGDQQRAAALAAVVPAQLGGVGGFTVTLQAAHHQHGLAFVFDAQILGLIAAHQLGQFLVDDLDDLLGGGQAFHDLLPHGTLRDLSAEVFGNFVVDIGFQQRHADFAHGSFDVRLGEFAFAAQFFEYAIQAIC